MKIGIKIIVAMVILAILVILVTSMFSFNFYRDTMINQVEQSGEQLGRMLTTSMRYNMQLNRQDSLKYTIENFSKHEDLAMVRLFCREGRVIYSSIPGENELIFDDKAVCMTCHGQDNQIKFPPPNQKTLSFTGKDGERYLSVFTPIMNEKSCSTAKCHYHSPEKKILAVLDVTMPLSHLDEKITTGNLRTAAFALMAIILFSAISLLVIRRLLLRPIAKLTEATSRVAIGEWTNPISGAQQDEMGDLIRHFNRMQEKLQVYQHQLILSDRLASMGRIAAGAAHEINNPLTGILTFAEDLIDEAPPNDARIEDYQIIKRETLRCRQIVRSLLDFARQDKPEISSLNINEVLKLTIALVEKLPQFQNCTLQTQFQKDIPLVRGDGGQLQQVFLNLMINAAQAMPEGGEVFIITRHEPGNPLIEVLVRDSGIGIKPEDQKRIFDPFFSKKSIGKSHGLGLSVTFGILEQHGGSIEVSSKPGEGATFIISLPAHRGGLKISDS